MKVRDLIAQLQLLDQDLDVTLYTGWEGPQHLELSDVLVEDCEYVHQLGHHAARDCRHVLLTS